MSSPHAERNKRGAPSGRRPGPGTHRLRGAEAIGRDDPLLSHPAENGPSRSDDRRFVRCKTARGDRVMKTVPRTSAAPAVFDHFERPTSAEVEAMRGLSASTVHEANQRLGFMQNMFPRVEGSLICGPAVTSLDHTGDNIMIHAALETWSARRCSGGHHQITVPPWHVRGPARRTRPRSRPCRRDRRCAGIRDVADIRRMKFPVWSKVICRMEPQVQSGMGQRSGGLRRSTCEPRRFDRGGRRRRRGRAARSLATSPVRRRREKQRKLNCGAVRKGRTES